MSSLDPTDDHIDFSDEEQVKRFVRSWRWLAVNIGNFKLLRINWVVSLFASILLFTFVMISLLQRGCLDEDRNCRAQVEFASWQTWITQNWTWLYIGTQDVWIVFIIYLFFSKYGNLKLGKKDEKPEFDNLSWFAMLFACGIGSGIWYWSASEPMYYYRGSGALMKPGFWNDDQRAQQAMFATFFHWGIHGWICYIVIALLLSFVTYRWNMPMTMRMCFYPLIGDHVFGFVGDFIDGISIACTTFGVCTSLGLGVFLIHSGIRRLDCADVSGLLKSKCAIPNTGDEAKHWQIGIIWVITAIATVSVISGLHRGIKWLSNITFLLGCIMLVLMLLLDNTWYLLNVFVQSFGHYFQWVIQVGHETDAFSQLGYEFKPRGNARHRAGMGVEDFDYTEDAGHANQLWGSVGKLEEKVSDALGHSFNGSFSSFYDSHNKRWIDWWTIFYWGWWISWGPFVGTFIAKISRGRTIREVIGGAFLAPTAYTFFWLSVYGGLAIKMQRAAEMALLPADAKEKGLLDYATGKADCSAMGYAAKQPVEGTDAYKLAQAGIYALSCRVSDDRIWDVMMPYGIIWKFLVTVGLICVILYFITSSDSGSYIDDSLSAGGLEHPPVLQKVFWCFTEGACATALLYSGGDTALKALQSVSIVSGLPYTFVICFACSALWTACKKDYGDEDYLAMDGDFNTHVLDIFEMMEMRTLSGPTYQQRLVALAKALFAPFISLMPALESCGFSKPHAMATTVLTGICFLLWPILQLAGIDANEQYATASLGWVFYLIFVTVVAFIRSRVREQSKIYGSLLSDWFTTLILYPMVASQLEMHAHSILKADEYSK